MPATRHIKRVITASPVLAATIGLTLAGSSSADLSTQIQAGKSAAQSLQSQISAQTSQIEKTAGGVQQAKAKLQMEQAALEQHIVQLRTVQTEVMSARDRLLALERRLQAASADLAANLRSSYENGSPNLVDVILTSNGFNDLLNQVSYLKDAQKQDARDVTVTLTDRKEVLAEATNLGRVELKDQALTNAIVQQRNAVAATESALVQQQINEESTRTHTRSKLATVQAHTAALQKKLDAIEAAAEAAARQTPTQVNQQVGGLAIDTGGMIQPPAGAPAAVAQMIYAGNAIATLPYIWGGGHGSFISPGYDCSGSVSYVLAAAGLLSSSETSGEFESYGDPGPGKWVTIYANSGHVWMQIGNWRFDTLALSRPLRESLESYRSVLHERDVRLLFAGLAISSTGSWAYRAGLIAYVYSRTHSLGWVAAAVMSRLLPQLLLSPYGGVIADRAEKIRVLVRVNAICTLWQGCLIVVVIVHGPVLLALIFIAINGGTNCIQAPAVGAAIPRLVGETNLVAANALNATLDNLTIVVGPMLGALLLLATGSVMAVFIANAVSFAVASLTAGGIRQRLPPTASDADPGAVRHQLAVGVKAILAEPAARTLVGFSVLVSFVAGTDTVLFIDVSTHKLGAGADGYLYLLIGLGIGGILISAVMERLASQPRLAWIIIAGVTGFCLPTALLVVIHSPVLAVLVQVVRGAATLAVDVLAITVMQRAVRRDQLGRVLGVFFAFVLGSVTLGAVVTPGIAAGLGLDGALLIMAFAPLAVSLAGLPSLLSVDRKAAAWSLALAPRVALLEHLGIFAGARRSLLDRMASESVDRDFAPGEQIIKQGDQADYLYVLLEGEVDVSFQAEPSDPPELIRTLTAPAYFGEIGILERIPRTASVSARSQCRCALIDGSTLLDGLSVASLSGSLIATSQRRLARTHGSKALETQLESVGAVP